VWKAQCGEILRRIPNTFHTRVGCLSWCYDLIYDILWLGPDSYQERNTLIPQLHEHDKLWQLMAIRVGCIDLKFMMQHSVLSMIMEGEIWVRMSNIPRSFNDEVTSLQQWEGEALAAKGISNTYQRKNTFIYHCVIVIPISTYYYWYRNLFALCGGNPTPLRNIILERGMTITFKNDHDLIVYSLEKIMPKRISISLWHSVCGGFHPWWDSNQD